MTIETSDLATHTIPDDELGRVADLMRFAACANTVRVLSTLLESPANVSRVAAATGLVQAVVSRFLGRGKLMGVAESRREGRKVYYRITSLGRNLLAVLDESASASAIDLGEGMTSDERKAQVARLIAGHASMLAMLAKREATVTQIATELGRFSQNVLTVLDMLSACGIVGSRPLTGTGKGGSRKIYFLTDRGRTLWGAVLPLVDIHKSSDVAA